MVCVWLRLELPALEVSALRVEFPGAQFFTEMDAQNNSQLLETADAAFTDRPLSEELVKGLPNLRWLHVTRGGTYPFLTRSIVQRPVTVTNSRGIHARHVSEAGLAYIFAFGKGLLRVWEARSQKRLITAVCDDMSSKTVGVIGLGAIGSELAKKAKSLGMKVIATKKNPLERPSYVDEIGGPEFLSSLLSRADFAVICLPNIPAVEGIIKGSHLKLMKASAYLINLTAQRAVDEKLLVEALKNGWISGIAVDVLNHEMPRPESEIWSLPNAIIAPRITGGINDNLEFLLPIFKENLQRFLAGEALMNITDKEVGY